MTLLMERGDSPFREELSVALEQKYLFLKEKDGGAYWVEIYAVLLIRRDSFLKRRKDFLKLRRSSAQLHRFDVGQSIVACYH